MDEKEKKDKSGKVVKENEGGKKEKGRENIRRGRETRK